MLEDRTLLATVRWINASGGDWGIATNWRDPQGVNRLPGSGDDAIIDLANISVTHSTGTDSVRSLVTSNGTFNLVGGTLNITITLQGNSTFQLSGGTLGNATVMAGTTITGTGGTLNGVTLAGRLDIAGVYAGLGVSNGLTLNGGTVNFINNQSIYGGLLFSGNQALAGNGTVNFQGSGRIRVGGNGSVLTIGPNVTVHGSNGYIGQDEGLTSSLVVQGAIRADTAGTSITVNATNWRSSGILQASSGGSLALAGSWTNSGSISIDGGGALSFNGSPWTNTGTITATNSTVNLGGSFTLATLGTFHSSGGTVNLTGNLDNTGTTLSLDDSTGPWQLAGGTINQGQVSSAGSARLIATDRGGTLNGVTLAGRLDIAGVSAGLGVSNGLTLNGGTVNFINNQSIYGGLLFSGNQALAGNGTVNFQGSGRIRVGGNGSVLTIGPNVTVHGSNGYIGQDEGLTSSLVVQGAIRADTAGTSITVNATNWRSSGILQASSGGNLALAGSWTSSGSISIAGGGTLSLNGSSWSNTGTITATDSTVNLGDSFTLASLGTFQRSGGTVNLTGNLDNTGTTLALDDNTGPWQLMGGTINRGQVSSAGSARLIVTDRGGTLNGVTLAGRLDIAGVYAGLGVNNGLTLNGGTVNFINQSYIYGGLLFSGNQTLAGSGTISFQGGNGRIRVIGNGSVLTIGPGITIHGSNGYIGQDDGGPPTSLVLQGAIRADTAGTNIAVNVTSLRNTGRIDASLGTIEIQGPEIRVDDSGVITSQSPGTIIIRGNLLGNTRNVDRFAPFGTVLMSSHGTMANPQLLEVMGQDQGNVAGGFSRNFVYGTLQIGDNNYVKLVDNSMTGRALYVSTLIVPTGSTLNLNGLHVYARASDIRGPIVGGPVNQVPPGPLALATPAPGFITSDQQVDEWTIFARAGQSVRVILSTGAQGNPPPLQPFLNFARLRIADQNNQELASGMNSQSGADINLLIDNLPADGTYRLQVRAQPANTGHYVVTAWDATIGIRPLNLNQIISGQIDAPYRADRWTFLAAAGDQVRFDLINSNAGSSSI
jgi:hypothetical protein